MALSGPPDNVPQLDHAHLKVLESYESCGADPWPFGRKVVDHARGGAGGGRGGGLGRAGACAGPCTGTPTHATRRRRAVEPRRTARPRRGYWGAGLGPIGAGHARRNKAGPSGRAPHDDRHVRDPLPLGACGLRQLLRARSPACRRPALLSRVAGVELRVIIFEHGCPRGARPTARRRSTRSAPGQAGRGSARAPRRARDSTRDARVFLLLLCCLSVSLSANRHPDSIADCFVQKGASAEPRPPARSP